MINANFGAGILYIVDREWIELAQNFTLDMHTS